MESYRHCSELQAFAYVVQAAFKFNMYKGTDLFSSFIRSMVEVTA